MRECQIGLRISAEKHHSEQKSGNLKPLLKISNLQRESLDLSKLGWINPQKLNKSEKYIIERGSILISMGGHYFGRVGFNYSVGEFYFFNHIQKIATKDPLILNAKYLLYVLIRKEKN